MLWVKFDTWFEQSINQQLWRRILNYQLLVLILNSSFVIDQSPKNCGFRNNSMGGGSGSEKCRNNTVISAGFSELRDNIDARAWQAAGLPAAPFNAIVIGVTSWWLRKKRPKWVCKVIVLREFFQYHLKTLSLCEHTFVGHIWWFLAIIFSS